MISEKQLAANRENAKKSTGPTTQEGKDRSRLNAFRHGCSKQTHILPESEMEAYREFTQPLAASFQPANHIESNLAQQYADYQWRINRCAALENNLFTLGDIENNAANLQIALEEARIAACNAKTFRQESREFDRLSLYCQRLQNGAAKVLKQLQQLQAERKQEEKAELPEAAAIYRKFQAAGTAFDPQENGFVSPLFLIEAFVRREDLKNLHVIAA